MGRTGWLILSGLTVLALGLRFAGLENIPPGLYYDEAFNGLDAIALRTTPLPEWPLFFQANFGREPLFIWLTAFSHTLWGPSNFAVRYVSAIAGALTIPSLAWLGWEAAPLLGIAQRRRFALWCAAGALTLLWLQIFSRYGVRLSLFLWIEVIFWASLWRGWSNESGGRGWWLLAGSLLGLSLYTYLPARLLPLALLIPVTVTLIIRPQNQRRTLVGFAILGGAALLVALPLLLVFFANPETFFGRSGQVARLSPGEIGANLLPVLGMFFIEGDANPRSNLPLRPLLDPLMAILFTAGLLHSALSLRKRTTLPGHLWLWGGLLLMILPTLLSELAPSFPRAIGAAPFVVLMLALGAEFVLFLLRRYRPGHEAISTPLLGGIFLVSIFLGTRAYFVDWARSPDLFAAWDVGFGHLAGEIVAEEPEQAIFLSPRGKDHPVLHYRLTQADAERPLQGFNGMSCVRVSERGPASYYVLTKEDFRTLALLDGALSEAQIETVVTDPWGESWAQRLHQPSGAEPQFDFRELPRRFGEDIELLGYQLLPEERALPGERLYVRLFWRVDQAIATDYTLFVHLLAGEPSSLAYITGIDRPPGDGSCPTTEWFPGELIVDEVELSVPSELPQGPIQLGIGLYNTESGLSLPIDGGSQERLLIALDP